MEFELKNLALNQDFVPAVGSKEKVTSIQVRRPGKTEFFRVCDNPNYVGYFGLLEVNIAGGRETYLVLPEQCESHADFVQPKHLFLAQNTEKGNFLIPVKDPHAGTRKSTWAQSLMDAIQEAKRHWVRVLADQSIGAYRCHIATATIPDPIWPDESFMQLILKAFDGLIIDSNNHPVLRRIREGA